MDLWVPAPRGARTRCWAPDALGGGASRSSSPGTLGLRGSVCASVSPCPPPLTSLLYGLLQGHLLQGLFRSSHILRPLAQLHRQRLFSK